MPYRLEDIEPDEISLVDVPANKRKLLFIKAAGGGTYLVCACGHEEALVDFLKSASEECPGCGESLEDSAVKIISKRQGARTMKKKLSELIKEFIGEDELSAEEMEELEKAEKKIPPDAAKALKEVVTTLTKFKSDFPDEIKELINTLAKYAAYGYGYPEKKPEKSDEAEAEIKEEMKTLRERVAQLEEKKGGTKKSLTGQDEDEEETEKSSKWPSFFQEEEK